MAYLNVNMSVSPPCVHTFMYILKVTCSPIRPVQLSGRNSDVFFFSAALTNSSSVTLKYLFHVALGWDGIHLISFFNAGIFFILFDYSNDRIANFLHVTTGIFTLQTIWRPVVVTLKQVFMCEGHEFDGRLGYISKHGQLEVFKLSYEGFFFDQTVCPPLSRRPHVCLAFACLHEIKKKKKTVSPPPTVLTQTFCNHLEPSTTKQLKCSRIPPLGPWSRPNMKRIVCFLECFS